jgi:purine nucleosidase
VATKHVILDTDIGTDVDDCLTLALILASPELDLIGVTTVYGDVLLRARMALKLLKLRGREDAPVAAGASQPLMRKRAIYWEGHEGKGLLEPEDAALAPSVEHAVDFIVRTVMAHPGEVHLLAIGPLTNVALAFLREPRLAQNLAGLMLMGGVVGGPATLHLPWVEHNIRCDPEAAYVVFSAGAPLTFVPLDVTTQVRIRTEDVARIRAVGDPYHRAVADQVDLYPGFTRRGGWTFLHDPLAAAVLVRPDLVTLTAVRALVETQGEHTAGATLVALPKEGEPATAAVALAVDAPSAEAFIVGRLAG